MISEPMTLVTDWVLAAVGGCLVTLYRPQAPPPKKAAAPPAHAAPAPETEARPG